jgi:hypothetical protein
MENEERKSKAYLTATIPRQPRYLLNAVAQPKKNHKFGQESNGHERVKSNITVPKTNHNTTPNPRSQ